MTSTQWLVLGLVATIGHVMAWVWYRADKRQATICRKRIYAIEAKPAQWRREFINSLYIPIHAVFLAWPAFTLRRSKISELLPRTTLNDGTSFASSHGSCQLRQSCIALKGPREIVKIVEAMVDGQSQFRHNRRVLLIGS